MESDSLGVWPTSRHESGAFHLGTRNFPDFPQRFCQSRVTLVVAKVSFWPPCLKSCGISEVEVTLTIVMNLKPIIALLMGLVIQFAQMQSCVAASSVNPCEGKAPSLCCCEGLQSCPCAGNSNPDQQPAPLIPAAVDLKFLVSNAPGTNTLNAPISPRTDVVVSIASRSEAWRSYPGVTLSVAFCRFVI